MSETTNHWSAEISDYIGGERWVPRAEAEARCAQVAAERTAEIVAAVKRAEQGIAGEVNVEWAWKFIEREFGSSRPGG